MEKNKMSACTLHSNNYILFGKSSFADNRVALETPPVFRVSGRFPGAYSVWGSHGNGSCRECAIKLNHRHMQHIQ